MDSQRKAILKHLRSGRTLTPIQALNRYGCFRLGARILELRKTGLSVVNLNKSGYARYKLEAE